MAGKKKGGKKGESTAQTEADAKQAAEEPGILDRVQVTDVQIKRYATYQQPDAEQVEKIQRMRDGGGALMQLIKDNTPNCADQSAAIRHVRDAIATANAAVVLRGK